MGVGGKTASQPHTRSAFDAPHEACLIRTLTPGHVLAFTAFLILPLAVMAPILLSSLVAAVGLAALVLLLLDPRLASGIPWGFVVGLGLLLAWGGLSTLWSVDAAQSLLLAGKLLASLVGGTALVALARSLSTDARRMVEGALILGVATGFALLAFEQATGGAIHRAARQFLNPEDPRFVYSVAFNRSTVMIALLIWPAICGLLRRGHRLLAGLAFAAGLALIGQLENTASLLAGAIGLVVFAAALVSAKWTARTLVALVLVGTALIPFAPTTVLEPNRMARLVPGIEMPHFHRLVIWHFVAERIAERPVAGWGLNASRSIPGGSDAVLLVLGDRDGDGAAVAKLRQSVMEQLPLHPHSAALQWWLELGAVGALMGAGLIVALIHASRRRSGARAETAATLAMVTAAISVSMLSYNIWQSWWVAALWLCAAMVLAVRRGEHARD